MAGIVGQVKILLRCIWTVVKHPPTLLYPLLLPAVMIGAIGGTAFLALSVGTDMGLALPNSDTAWLVVAAIGLFLNFVGLPAAFVFFNVAYCYEIHRLYTGNRPLPGAGLVVAVRQLPTIVAGTLLVVVTFTAGVTASGSANKLAEKAGTGARVGSHTVATFLYPALAIERGGAREILSQIKDAVTNRFGSATVTSVGVGRITGKFFLLGLAAAVGLVGAGFLGRLPFEADFAFLPVEPGLPQVFALAGIAAFAGLYLAIMLNSFVTGPISTALYLYATDEEVPAMLALDVDEMTG